MKHSILLVEDEVNILKVLSAALKKEEQLTDAYDSTLIEGLSIRVEPAVGDKCERCWIHDTSVGENPDQATICSRCGQALDEMGATGSQ